MIRASMTGNPLHLSLNYKFLLPILLQNLQSPLAAPCISNLFTDLSKPVFSNELCSLGELVAYTTLRLLKPQCDIDPSWEEEDVTKAMVRTLNQIYERTVPKKDNESASVKYFSAPAFCYTFPYLRSSLQSSYSKKHESFVHDGLQIISVHSKMRGQNIIDSERNVYHPKYLPVQQVLQLLVELISKLNKYLVYLFVS